MGSVMLTSFLDEMEKIGYTLQGHTDFQGLKIAIENRKGSVRKGKDGDGKEWRTKMKHPYGYIVRTRGADDEPVDAYVGPDKDAPCAHVVHQKDKDTGAYDEDKVMLGFRSKKEAKEAFLKHYNSPKFLGPISTVPMDRLKELVASKRRLVKIAEPPPPKGVSAAEWDKHLAKGPKKRSTWDRIRKAGPGVGGAIGLAAGLATGRRGKLLSSAVKGLGTGATLGWVPDMASSAKEALS